MRDTRAQPARIPSSITGCWAKCSAPNRAGPLQTLFLKFYQFTVSVGLPYVIFYKKQELGQVNQRFSPKFQPSPIQGDSFAAEAAKAAPSSLCIYFLWEIWIMETTHNLLDFSYKYLSSPKPPSTMQIHSASTPFRKFSMTSCHKVQ